METHDGGGKGRTMTTMDKTTSMPPLYDLTFDAVIVGNGDFPTHPAALALLHGASCICCCDGAAEQLVDAGFTPDTIVGDGDSLPAHLKQIFADRLYIVNEQEDNDQTKATRWCLAHGKKRIAYVGATGRREDHTIGDIALLPRYMSEMGIEPVMVTDFGFFIPAHGETTFHTFARQQVSIFNVSCRTLEGDGLRWQPYAYVSAWQGTLNEAIGNAVTMRGDGLYMMYFTHDAKQ